MYLQIYNVIFFNPRCNSDEHKIQLARGAEIVAVGQALDSVVCGVCVCVCDAARVCWPSGVVIVIDVGILKMLLSPSLCVFLDAFT